MHGDGTNHERDYAMNVAMGLNQQEDEILSFEVSDETLESAAGSETAVNYTLGGCTAIQTCPVL